MAVLELKSIRKFYGKKVVLDDISCEFEKGIYGLLGPNGAGKTTLISIVVNILKPNGGEVIFEGSSTKKLGSAFFGNVGYIPQYPSFYRNYTAQEFLEYTAVIKGIKNKDAKRRISDLFEFVNLADDKNKKVGAFSGGMKQRLGIAQALINDPKLLILDEPTAGLDPKERIRFRNLISRISCDKTVIIATHIVQDIESIAEKAVLINNGKIICCDTPENLIESAAPFACGLGYFFLIMLCKVFLTNDLGKMINLFNPVSMLTSYDLLSDFNIANFFGTPVFTWQAVLFIGRNYDSNGFLGLDSLFPEIGTVSPDTNEELFSNLVNGKGNKLYFYSNNGYVSYNLSDGTLTHPEESEYVNETAN